MQTDLCNLAFVALNIIDWYKESHWYQIALMFFNKTTYLKILSLSHFKYLLDFISYLNRALTIKKYLNASIMHSNFEMIGTKNI